MSNCPKCGAEWNGIRGSAYGYTPYPCGSRFDRHGCLHQSKDCRIAQLKSQLTTLLDCIDDYCPPNPDDDTRQWTCDFNEYHRGCVLFKGGIPPEDWEKLKPLFDKRFGGGGDE